MRKHAQLSTHGLHENIDRNNPYLGDYEKKNPQAIIQLRGRHSLQYCWNSCTSVGYHLPLHCDVYSVGQSIVLDSL